MRIRIIRSIATGGRAFKPGSVVDIDKLTAEAWLRAGVAMEDKALDPPKEVKGGGKKTKAAGSSKGRADKSSGGKKSS